MYFFTDGAMASFNVDYPLAIWRDLSNQTERKYGKPIVKTMRFQSMVTHQLRWTFGDEQILWFTHFAGGDINGNAIPHPYMITFGPQDDTK
jgi:hypothetical protein